MPEDPEVIEERRRHAQAVAAERSKALTENYRRPFGADPAAQGDDKDDAPATREVDDR